MDTGSVQDQNAARSPGQRGRKLILNQIGWASLFLAPNFILVMLFTFIPAVGGLALSTAEWDVFSAPKFVGSENYVDLVDDDDFWIALRNTIVYTVTTVPVSIALSLVLAIVLNQRLPGTLIFRTVFFIPVIMSGVLVSHTWQWLFNADYGPVNYFLWQIGIKGPRWLNDPRWSLAAVVIVTIWKSLGFNMIILLAALQDVPQTFYDAAKIDGAGNWAEFRHVTLPMIAAPIPGTEGVTNDRIGMNMWGPWASWYIMREVEFDWDVVPIPMGTEEVVLAWGSTLAAFKSSEHQDEVRQFMEFFLSPDTQFQRAADWAWFPPGQAATEMEGFMEVDVLALTADQKQFVIDSVANGRAPFVHREEARLQNIYDQELSLVFAGEKTMDEALAAIQEGWQDILS